jgi:hypothetical protein
MRTSNVPAQITTIEDKIAGNLTLQQMILLASPIFIDFAVYTIFPKELKLNTYKLILMLLITGVLASLAIRIKTKTLLVWMVTVTKYRLRARYYIFDKNNDYLRGLDLASPFIAYEIGASVSKKDSKKVNRKLIEGDYIKLEHILTNSSANLTFTSNRKGVLHVSFTEIK